MVDTYTTTATTNFDKTVTTLVLKTIAENIRRKTLYMIPGAYMQGTLIPGTNLIRHVAYGDLSILSPAQSDGTPPWLTEGVTPSVEALSISYDEFGVNQAGRLVGITDRALKYNPHNLFAIAAERVAWNALATFDAIVASVVQGITATTTNGHAAAALTTSDYLTAAQVRLIVAKMRARGIPTINGYYIAMVHPFAVYDLMSDSAWVNVANYASPENMLTGEVGRLYGVRFVENTVGTWVNNTGGGAAIPVYSTLFFGKEFFAFGDFGSIESYMIRPGGDHGDPLAQKGLVGWKGWIGAKVLTTLNSPGGGGVPRAIRLVHAGSIAGEASI